MLKVLDVSTKIAGTIRVVAETMCRPIKVYCVAQRKNPCPELTSCTKAANATIAGLIVVQKAIGDAAKLLAGSAPR